MALTALAGRYFISSCLYWIRSLWPLLVSVIVFRVIFVLHCSLVILICALFDLVLGLLFVLRLITFVCYIAYCSVFFCFLRDIPG